MKQEARGKMNKLKGRMKEAAGIITGNRKLEQEGFQQRAKGAVQEKVGKVRRKVGELIDKANHGLGETQSSSNDSPLPASGPFERNLP